jgi:hypothetical protein
MQRRSPFLTPIQEIALNLIFVVMGENRFNRSYEEYVGIAARLPPLKVLKSKLDELLQHLHRCSGCNGVLLAEICRFKAGDQIITYEPYPKTISYETIRIALVNSGMRKPRWENVRRSRPLRSRADRSASAIRRQRAPSQATTSEVVGRRR